MINWSAYKVQLINLMITKEAKCYLPTGTQIKWQPHFLSNSLLHQWMNEGMNWYIFFHYKLQELLSKIRTVIIIGLFCKWHSMQISKWTECGKFYMIPCATWKVVSLKPSCNCLTQSVCSAGLQIFLQLANTTS